MSDLLKKVVAEY